MGTPTAEGCTMVLNQLEQTMVSKSSWDVTTSQRPSRQGIVEEIVTSFPQKNSCMSFMCRPKNLSLHILSHIYVVNPNEYRKGDN